MKRAIGRHRSVREREAVVSVFESSGLSVGQFCMRAGVSLSSFQRWRARCQARLSPPAPRTAAAEPSAFIDLGALGVTRERLELRLDLGGGMALQLARG